MSDPKLRSLRWGGPCLLGLVFALSLGACDERGSSSPEPGPMDRTQGRGLRLQEEEIRVDLAEAGSTVHLKLHRTGSAPVAGTVQLDLRRVADGEVLASTERAFELEQAEQDLSLPLAFGLSPDEDPASLAAYVLRYHLRWEGDALWGRRSLFAALPSTETQVLGPDTLRSGSDTQLRILARDPMTGAPRADLPVSIHLERADEAPVLLFEGRTDAFGTLAAPVQPGDELVGQGTLAVSVDAPGRAQEIRAAVAVERPTRILLTTDKPIYQPGQTLHLRALALRRPRLVPDAGQPLVFEIFDGKDNKVERVSVTTDAYGIASTEFRLAREVNMGLYRIRASLGELSTEKSVTVERYSLPKFDVGLELDREVYLAGSLLEGTLRVRYFFGQPVQAGAVRIAAATYDVERSVFAELQGATNDEGLFRFQVQLPDYVVGLPLEQGGGLVELGVDVQDSAGQSRSVTRTLRIAAAPLEVSLVPESGELVAGLVNRLWVRSLDASGNPVAASHRLEVAGSPAQEFRTDERGLGQVSLAVPLERAEVVATLSSQDAQGNQVQREHRLTVGGATLAGAVLLRSDRALYRVGDTLRLEILTLGAPDRVYLDVIRGGQTLLTTAVQPDAEGRAETSLDLSPDHAGALQIDAYYLALGSSLRRDTLRVYVEPADALQVQIEADRDVYGPGEEAHLRLRVTDAQGDGRAAALGLQAVDEAVYGLMEFRPGLEKTYFQIEAELGQPRYQIGVPSLQVLAADPAAVDSPQAQEEARLLFSASDEGPAQGISVNTYAHSLEQVQATARPLVELAAQELLARVRSALETGWLERDEVGERLETGFGPIYDPWGQTLRIRRVDEQNVEILSLGPDERLGSADDVLLSWNVDWVAYGGGLQNDRNGDDGDWDFAEAADGEPGPPMAGGEGEGEAEGGGGGGGAAAPRVRRDFPETLYVEPALITDGRGEAELTLPLADSITTWRLSAMANSAEGALGSTDFGVRVFQEFFTDIDFPATLTRGDEFWAPVVVYNYLDHPQTVRLEVEAGAWCSLLGPATSQMQLEPGEVRGLRIPLRVEQVGLHELTVFAYGEGSQDAVARTVLVVPDGKREERVASGRLGDPVRVPLEIPGNAVEGSAQALVKIYPGVFSQVVEGLDSVLRMPSGCFEQTSSSTWPNVLVARYLAETDGASPEIELKAHEYINTGYQRLLTFEVPGGGFEWFGRAPSHVVLTAYGLLEFRDMAEVRPVDEAMIGRTRAWLLSQQKADGHWEVAGRGLDETGQLSDPATVTAYVAFALAAAGEEGAPMDRARAYLEPRLADMGTYTLALTANFLVQAYADPAVSRRILDELARRVEANLAAADPAPAGAHWETDEQTTTYGQGEGAWVETTALATHALLVAGVHAEITDPALAWLVNAKRADGSWGSTAGTVWSIKCLLQSLRGGRDEEADATVRVLLDGVERASFRVTADTSDVMRQAELGEWLVPGSEQLVEVLLEGQGRLQYGVVQSWHVPWDEAPPPEGPLSIEVSYDRTQLQVDDTVTVNVTLRNRDLAYADMVMVDLGIPPGFDLVFEDLEALRQQQVFSKFEATERQLLLYFPVLRPERPLSFAYRMVARDPIRAQAPPSRVYSYYNPEVGAPAQPVEVEVQED